MIALKGNNENETHKLSGNKNDVVGIENNQRDKKTPPEETGQENILDLFRWPLLFKHIVISTLLWWVVIRSWSYMKEIEPSYTVYYYDTVP